MVAKKVSAKELTDEMIKVGRLQYYVIFLMATGLIIVGKPFIIWWVGKEYEQSYYVALLLIIPVCFPLIQNLGISICQAMNKHKFRAIMTTIMAGINVFISYFLAKKFGAIGSAFGTSVALILCNVIIMNFYYKEEIKLEIGRFWKNIFLMTLSFSIPLGIILIIINLLELTGIISVIVYASLYILLYCLFIYFITMNDYEKKLVNNLFSRLCLKRN